MTTMRMSGPDLGLAEFSDLTEERQAELADQLRKSRSESATEAVHQELLQRHLRLVRKLAFGFRHTHVETEDLVAAGNLALWQAVRRWDPDRGPVFPWALRWVKTAMNREVDGSRQIRIPEEIAYQKAIARRLRSDEQLADQEIATRLGISTERLGVIENLPVAESILDSTTDSGTPLASSLRFEGRGPEEEAELTEITSMIHLALQELTGLEREVMEARWGLNGSAAASLRAIGTRYGVGREAMRRVEAGAVAKLRHPSFPVPLKALLQPEE